MHTPRPPFPPSQIRFDSAPSALASKPFRNEETHLCTVYSPGRRYVVEAITQTTAPYGDKFKIYIRCGSRSKYGKRRARSSAIEGNLIVRSLFSGSLLLRVRWLPSLGPDCAVHHSA